MVFIIITVLFAFTKGILWGVPLLSLARNKKNGYLSPDEMG
jgi:hypothetical protein